MPQNKKGDAIKRATAPLVIKDPLLAAGLPTMKTLKRSKTVLRNPERVGVRKYDR
tara:strand:- start:534 stop:698 length:165 start_codon:yes stop_codon:yes gene_type:complete